jgi:hypothetical protein
MDVQDRQIRNFKRAMKALKWWEVRVPSRISKMSPEEIYCEGFSSGYNCKVAELEKHKPFPIFKFVKEEDVCNIKGEHICNKLYHE